MHLEPLFLPIYIEIQFSFEKHNISENIKKVRVKSKGSK